MRERQPNLVPSVTDKEEEEEPAPDGALHGVEDEANPPPLRDHGRLLNWARNILLNHGGAAAVELIDRHYDYFDLLPPGNKFFPSDSELIVYYLKRKVMNLPLPPHRIWSVELYNHDPYYLSERYKRWGLKDWYFFTPRERKYPNGDRPRRTTGNGYWKATGSDKAIKWGRSIIGFRKTLVFYVGNPPNGSKTDWIMHEFRVNSPPRARTHQHDMTLDDWVLCRIYKKPTKKSRPAKRQRLGEEKDGDGDGDGDGNGNAAVYPPLPYLPLDFPQNAPNYLITDDADADATADAGATQPTTFPGSQNFGSIDDNLSINNLEGHGQETQPNGSREFLFGGEENLLDSFGLSSEFDFSYHSDVEDLDDILSKKK
ncbi:NAC domain-containing protein 48-like [Diospyros lotus]|uniref:NAC domain-containing protein 48-like n=1 Tax=Diospyros lotus TaxID=55363 RepID=UPI002254BA1B|nr:NAC domain-containing protein 48-like [Diospyros lotus]